MAIKKLRPMTSGTRFMSKSSFEEITKDAPEKSLTVSLKKSGGRNNEHNSNRMGECIPKNSR